MSGTAKIACTELRKLGYSNSFTVPPSVRACSEPIVLTGNGWIPEARLADGTERGVEKVSVLVCCDCAADAERTCCAVERDLQNTAWASADAFGGCRMVGVATGKPTYRGRDGSGRWLWGFEMDCTAVRNFG